jgi:uncharacterized protein (TIGR03435 family)
MYSIEAKPGAPCNRDQTRNMLRTLLAKQFKLRLRREKKETWVYALVLAKNGPKLTELNWDPANEDGTFRMGGGNLNSQVCPCRIWPRPCLD